MPPTSAHVPLFRRSNGNIAPLPLWMLYPVFFAAVYGSHLTLLRLPYFWDEGGYYIPAAWDFFRTGTLIPQSTVTNAHPPLPSILLAGWWHLSGFVPSGTRTLVCMMSAAALLAVFRIARMLLGTRAAVATTLLTGVYPVWFAQSTLAHADIFAAAFTLWALSFYFEGRESTYAKGDACGKGERPPPAGWRAREMALASSLFSLAALSKETAIVTPLALAAWEGYLLVRERGTPGLRRAHAEWIAWLAAPVLPLAAWYAFHFYRTGFVFGNPEFLRYNATANLDLRRIAVCLYHRLLHLTLHMNLFVPVTCAAAAFFMPALADRRQIPRPVLQAVAVILVANWIAFSVLGGALLTRYLLPMYPLILLCCVAEWQRRLLRWEWLAALSVAGLVAGIWINPPYAFAPEDNLTYRDMIVLHQRAVTMITQKWPQATVLTAWPAVSELAKPELGYTRIVVKTFPVQNFSLAEMEKAAADPGDFDTALIFSTKWAPVRGDLDLSRRGRAADARYFDFHEDVSPFEAAAILHGDLFWQARIRGEWVAILRFPRVVNAQLDQEPATRASTSRR